MEREKLHLTWDRIEMLVDIILRDMKAKKLKVEYIGAVPRGGFIPAVMMAHKLGINDVSPYFDLVAAEGTVLVVDDIADSGRTLELVKEAFRETPNQLYIATLIVNDNAKPRPDFEGVKGTGYYWHVFPWEKDPDGDQRRYMGDVRNRT